MSKKTEELIDVLDAELRAAGLCFGVDRADDMAQSVLRRVVKRLGGQSIYVRTTVRNRAKIEQAVKHDFNGNNQTEVARKQGVSVRTVYRIISGGRQAAGHTADPNPTSGEITVPPYTH